MLLFNNGHRPAGAKVSAATAAASLTSAPARRGAALIDAIVGAIMLGVALSVIISISSRSLATQNDGERRMVAAWLADEILNHVLMEGPIEFRRSVDTRGEYGPPFENYHYDVEIEDIGLNMPFRVTATISWPSGRSTESIQVQTLIAERFGDEHDHRREPSEMLDREQWHYDRRFPPEEDAAMRRGSATAPGLGGRNLPPAPSGSDTRGGGGGGGRSR